MGICLNRFCYLCFLQVYFLTLGNTLHHYIISKSIRYYDQLPVTYAILMYSSTNKDFTMNLSRNIWINGRFCMYDIPDGQIISASNDNNERLYLQYSENFDKLRIL